MNTISIVNQHVYTEKLARFRIHNTRVVTDFDSTLTSHNGKTSWSLLSNSGLMPMEYATKRNELKEKYYPYEISATISNEERKKYMKIWWQAHLSLLTEFGLQKSILESVVSQEMHIRKGVHEALHFFDIHEIPVHILSAGIYQSIEKVLGNEGQLTENIFIGSNKLIFNNDGICTGFSDDLVIHASNKDDYSLPQNIQDTYQDRSNIILMGDSIDDIKMISEKDRNNAIAIGFCVSNKRDQKQKFLDTFDVVIESDDSDEGFMQELLGTIGK